MASVWILFLALLILLVAGVPIAIALGIASAIFLISSKLVPLIHVASVLFTSIDSFPIMAIPFFILAGNVMGYGGISKRLINFAEQIVGPVSGGLALVSIITCLFFGAISGSGPATVAAVGGIMIPAMISRGYHGGFASAVNAASGGLGVLIPPSVPFIVYSLSAEQSVAKLFLAGILPGILLALCLMLPSYLISKKQGWKGEKDGRSITNFLQALNDAKYALLAPIIILGGIYGGIFTPTEAAAVAAVYGLIVGVFIFKELGMSDLIRIGIESGITSSVIVILIAMATIFGQVLTIQQVPSAIAQWMLGLSNNPLVFLVLLNIFLLFVGCVMEALAAIIILTPLLLPIAVQLGIDPIHFGVIMVLNLAVGFITPPVGVNLFVASGISKIPLHIIAKSILPLFIGMLVALILVTYCPVISLYLPNLLIK